MSGDLPVDPDPERLPPGRALHLRPSSLAIVAAGGACGTAAREALSLVVPDLGLLPLAIFAINVTGAFLLGVLLEALVRRGPDLGRRRTLRLLLGTGFLGGYTTYSALADDSAQLLGGGHLLHGAGYALATVLVGALATWTGIAAAAARHRRSAR